MRAWELQQAIRSRLTDSSEVASAGVTAVYDHVPQCADFPYVVIGEDSGTPADTDDTLDADHIVTVHTWSRYRGRKQTKKIQQAVYDVLHRQPLSIGNAQFVDCTLESQETFLDADGLTRHGVQRFRILLDDVR